MARKEELSDHMASIDVDQLAEDFEYAMDHLDMREDRGTTLNPMNQLRSKADSH